MATLVRECTFSSFMKCNPTPFHGKEGAIELCRWFEKSEMVFSISDCAERNKMMLEEFCPDKEVHRMEDELRSLKLRDTNIATYTQRFNELGFLCPEAVPTEKKKVEAYIKGLPENIKGEVTSSRPVNLNEVVRMAHTLMEPKIQAKPENPVRLDTSYEVELAGGRLLELMLLKRPKENTKCVNAAESYCCQSNVNTARLELKLFRDVAAAAHMNPQVVSAAKLPILNPNEFDLRKMRIEQSGLLKASKNLDHLIESQRSDQVKEGVGYNAIPPFAADLYLSPKKDLS
nr:hypothetical protein [Tanacetum cinerariifolium]